MKFQRDQFVSEFSCKPISAVCATRFHTAEGGTSGKNTSSQQDQVQATSQTGPVVGHDGNINTGLSIAHSGSGAINVTDQGAVAAAFDFGKEVLLTNANTAKANVDSNQSFLDGITQLIASNSAGGANEQQSKLLLYLGIGVLVVAAIFFFRR